ncbi:hypothetical protein TNCV_4427211 [Trichonephila clavipes]|nr:hypothetical protein TNCV_4427211 [Trichonephila clavipes]
MDLIILNHSQVTKMTPELSLKEQTSRTSLRQTSRPHQREDFKSQQIQRASVPPHWKPSEDFEPKIRQ